MDAILAIFLLLIVFLVVNTAITLPTSDYSYESKEIRTAQDTMELLSGKIDFNDNTFLAEISNILKEGKNSKESIRQVSEISKDKLNITVDELMQRFVRGDSSRTTEGSGLGISIAKSLTELQKGSFNIHLDGDLFKVVLEF